MRVFVSPPLLLLLVPLLGCALNGELRSSSQPVAITTSAVFLDPADPGRTRLGRLEYRGGLVLTSAEPRFGGWSGLWISKDGAQLVSVSDETASSLSARPVYDAAGRLIDLAEARLAPLASISGAPVEGKSASDAEALAPGDHGWYVGFERQHRLWHYPAGREGLARPALPADTPRELQDAPSNGGLEAVAVLRDGRLLTLTEEQRGDGTARRGWLGRPGVWSPVWYDPAVDFSPSDATTLPSGDVLVLERGYSEERGARARLVRVPRAALAPGAHLAGELLAQIEPPLTVDNFEGVSARRTPAGETLIYLLTDDNLDHARQRTLLLMFALLPDPAR